MSQEIEDQAPEPSRTDPLFVRVWRYAEPVLAMTALVADHKQHEGLAFTARALVVSGQLAVSLLVGWGEDR